MTELWNCPDCPAEVDFDARREHLQAEHGVTYALGDEACPRCGVTPCARAATMTEARA